MADIRTVITTSAFESALEKFNITELRMLATNIKTKYVNGTKIIDGVKTPNIFNVKIYNNYKVPSEIQTPLGEVLGIGNVEEVSWNKLLIPTYMHASMIIQCRGFKLTRSGITMDYSVEYLAYEKVDRLERTPKNTFQGSYFNKNKRNVDGDDDSVDDDRKKPKFDVNEFA